MKNNKCSFLSRCADYIRTSVRNEIIRTSPIAYEHGYEDGYLDGSNSSLNKFPKDEIDNDERKIKVSSIDIIVTGTKDKPYFEIKYKEVGKDYYKEGFGSYCLDYVFDWKNECFVIEDEI